LDISTIFDKMKMKRILYFIIITATFFYSTSAFSQSRSDSLTPSNTVITGDTVKQQKTRTPVLSSQHLADSSKITSGSNNVSDTTTYKKDSTIVAIQKPVSRVNITNKILAQNRFINVKSPSQFFIESPHEVSGKEFLFYSLCIILLILALFKTFFKAYFSNLFRVYFNTSLRQTQLADQLEQAKFPSFIMNIFFVLTAGIYIWLLFKNYHPPRLINSNLLLPFCIIGVAALYFIKFLLLKFMGWVADIRDTTNNYIFAIFLVNKITGIILVPIIILLAFVNATWITAITNLSLMIFGLLFLSRYVKSYGAIDRKFSINPFHFIIYILGAEIIPLVIIYKVAVDYLI